MVEKNTIMTPIFSFPCRRATENPDVGGVAWVADVIAV